MELQQPSISLTSPNRGLVWSPEGAEVTRGYSLVITCSISSHYPGGVFLLMFSGSTITETKPAVNGSASFTIPAAEYEHQGNYSCVYEVTLSSRTFTSTTTAMMRATIKLPLLLLVSSVFAPLHLLLMVLVVVCLAYRKRQQARRDGAVVQTQLSLMDNCAVDEEEEEKEEKKKEEKEEEEEKKEKVEEEEEEV